MPVIVVLDEGNAPAFDGMGDFRKRIPIAIRHARVHLGKVFLALRQEKIDNFDHQFWVGPDLLLKFFRFEDGQIFMG